MKTEIYVIFDEAAQVYNKPFHLINEQVALRTAITLRNDPQSEICKHPSDYSMHYLGTYDDTTAEFVLEKRRCVVRFHELPRQTESMEVPGGTETAPGTNAA